MVYAVCNLIVTEMPKFALMKEKSDNTLIVNAFSYANQVLFKLLHILENRWMMKRLNERMEICTQMKKSLQFNIKFMQFLFSTVLF